MASLREISKQIIIILAFLGFMILAACTQTQEDALIEAATKVSVEIDEALVEAPQLAFAGKVTSLDGSRWLNDYVALVYKGSEEVGRDISQLGEFPESGEGKHDGLFFVEVKNAYDLTAVDLMPATPNQTFQDAPGVVGIKYIYTWLGETAPGHQSYVDVPSKRIGYWLVILPVSTNDLPTDFLDGPTTLTAENAVMASNGTVLELVTAVPQPDVTTAPPSVITNGVNWSRTVTGFTGNRWDAWMLYVNGQVNGIEWEQFKDDVLIYNPALEADGFVFLPEKQYVLPQN